MMRRNVVRRLAAFALAVGCAAGATACGEADTAVPGLSPAPSSAAPTPHSAPTINGVAACPTSDPEVPARADGLPDLTLPCLTAGPAVRLAGLRGVPTVINVWASWCPPCRDEIPHLVELDERAGDRVRILGIDLLDRNDPAIAVVEDFAMTYPSVIDADGDTRSALNVQAPPVTLFVDADGAIVGRKVGEIRSTAEFALLVRDYLGITL